MMEGGAMNSFDQGFIYIASPYSHPDKKVMHARYEVVAKYIAKAMRNKCIVYSPIVHHHPLSLCHALPTDWAFWREIDGNMLCAAVGLDVLCMDGWLSSIGVQSEIGIAIARGLPVRYFDPETGKELYVP